MGGTVDINKLADELLNLLHENGKNSKDNLGDVLEMLKISRPDVDWKKDWKKAEDAGKLLFGRNLAQPKPSIDAPTYLLLFITAEGSAKASLLRAERNPSLWERLTSDNGKWVLGTLMALAGLAVAYAALSKS